ncbi:MAG: hypothetical protein ACREX8_15250 [Gammaproteobacteria bacterium]
MATAIMSNQPRDFLTRYLSTTAPLWPWAPRSARLTPTWPPRPLADARQYKADIEQADRLVADVEATIRFTPSGSRTLLRLSV